MSTSLRRIMVIAVMAIVCAAPTRLVASVGYMWPQPEATRTIHLDVTVHSATGAPIMGVPLGPSDGQEFDGLERPPYFDAVTDQDGHASVDVTLPVAVKRIDLVLNQKLPAGKTRFDLRTRLEQIDGLQEQWSFSRSYPVYLLPEQANYQAQITVKPAVSIKARVVKANGTPVGRAEGFVGYTNGQTGQMTNSQGKVDLDGLPQGERFILIGTTNGFCNVMAVGPLTADTDIGDISVPEWVGETPVRIVKQAMPTAGASPRRASEGVEIVSENGVHVMQCRWIDGVAKSQGTAPSAIPLLPPGTYYLIPNTFGGIDRVDYAKFILLLRAGHSAAGTAIPKFTIPTGSQQEVVVQLENLQAAHEAVAAFVASLPPL